MDPDGEKRDTSHLNSEWGGGGVSLQLFQTQTLVAGLKASTSAKVGPELGFWIGLQDLNPEGKRVWARRRGLMILQEMLDGCLEADRGSNSQGTFHLNVW